MTYSAQVIGFDGEVHAEVYVNADSEKEARALLAICGIEEYTDLVAIVPEEAE